MTLTAPQVEERGLTRRVAERVSETLADERIDRRERGEPQPTPDEETLLARQVALAECARIGQSLRSEGRAPLDPASEQRLAAEAVAEVLGLGRLQPLLDDDEVSDVHVRGCAPVWVKLRTGRRESRPPIVETDEELVELIRRAATRIAKGERRFDSASPELNLQLPDGSRLFAVMDVSSAPSLVVRRHRFDIASLDELRIRGMVTPEVGDFLAAAVRARRNLVICGGTGSGKTTLLRALLNEVPRDERIVTIEDAYELGIERYPDRHPDHDALQSRPANIEGEGEITLADLTRMALRMDPDRVIVGEVRGAEAFPMLMAMSQGNNGSMCTMHADGTRSVFPKLAAYVSMASTGLPIETVNLIVASALHFVVYVEIDEGVRRVTSIREVVDADGSTIVSNEIFSIGPTGETERAYPLRGETRALLERHGYAGEFAR